jgi:uncharacterized protein YuzE
MRLTIDRESDALYLRLDETPVVESDEVQPGVILDFDGKGQVMGIELLQLSSRIASKCLLDFRFEITEPPKEKDKAAS